MFEITEAGRPAGVAENWLMSPAEEPANSCAIRRDRGASTHSWQKIYMLLMLNACGVLGGLPSQTASFRKERLEEFEPEPRKKLHDFVAQLPHEILINIGGLIIRIGFWGSSYYNYNKEPPKPYSNYIGPYITNLSHKP